VSRVGLRPIPIPSGVEVKIEGSDVTVSGQRGTLNLTVHRDMVLSQEDGVLRVARPSDEREHRALHGLTRSLVANMVTGVAEGYSKTLDLVGVGYRVQQSGDGIALSVMLSHSVEINPPPGVTLEVEGNNRIHVRGIDKQAVGQLAAQIRKVRPANVYTGKGIRYAGEVVRLKPGKSARRV
jgi:large subunit ribosomal protein L6